MSKFFNSTTLTTRTGEIIDMLWSNRCKTAAMAYIKQVGGKDIKTTKLTYTQHPSILTSCKTIALFKEDEATVVNGNGGTAWICFTKEADQFVRKLEGIAA